MNWPWRALAGPVLWAVAFVTIYGLHGAGCVWGWPARAAVIGDLQSFVLVTLWLLFLAAGLAIALRAGGDGGREGVIVRAGAWTGFAAIALTLFPVLGLTTCG